MEIWFVLLTIVCIAFLLNALLSFKSKSTLKLPPGPINVPIITTILWLRKSGTEIETTIRNLSSKFDPVISIPVGLRPVIIVSTRELAHEALVQKGAIFADRPKPVPTTKIISSNQHNATTAAYGPRWRTFRRNLTSEILHPSRAKEFRHARKWVLDILLDRLRASAISDTQHIKVIEHLRFAMCCLLVTMCFGKKLDESKIREIEEIQFTLLTSLRRFEILNYWPSMTRILFWGRWNELYGMKKKQHEQQVPLIRRRKQLKKQGGIIDDGESSELAICYVDTLLTMEFSDDNNTKRKLNEEEIVAACSEFLNAGFDTTSTALEWIMANLVKYPGIQAKLFQELKDVVRLLVILL